MKALLLEAFLLVTLLSLASCGPTTSSSTTSDPSYQYEDYDDELSEQDDFAYAEKPCPRDCKCVETVGSKLAKCWRLEIGTQKFGDDITDLSVENVDPKHPIELTDMIFKKLGLHQVTNIKIANSVVKSISSTAFRGLHELYSVNMSGNGIERMDPDTFAYNSKLSLLTLSDNPLALNKMPNGQFLNSTSIQELDISRCKLKSLPKKTFLKLPNLMYINLSGNKIDALDSIVFSELQDLEEVDLSDNFLRSVPGDLFKKNSEMATLKLGGNPLSTVNELEISELLTLDLGVSQIKKIGPSMFDGMHSISNLNLSGNGVQVIHSLAFHNMVELNYLDLSNNELDYVSSELIKENVDLDVFKLAHNPSLKKLPVEGFACAKKQFNIYLFDVSFCSLEIIGNNTFRTMPTISQLDFSHNRIRDLGSSLQYLERLVELDLSYNLLATLPEHTFEHNRDLGKLNLAGNPLTTITPSLFKYAASLTWLDISSCRLENLFHGDLDKSNMMTNLNFVNASNNQITAITSAELVMMPRLYTLDIQMNPLECNEDFRKLMKWLTHTRISPAVREVVASVSEYVNVKKSNDKTNWEFLAKQICGDPQLLPTEKAGTDIVEVSNDKKTNKKDDNKTDYDDIYDGDDYDEDDSDESDEADEDYDPDEKSENDIKNSTQAEKAVENVLSEAKKTVSKLGHINDVTEFIEKDNTNVDVKNKEDKKSSSSDIGGELFKQIVKDAEEKLEEMESDSVGIKIYNVKPGVYEHTFDDELIAEGITVDSTKSDYYQMLLWPSMIAIGTMLIVSAAVILLFLLCYQRKLRNVCVISTLTGNPNGKTKKDCGLVYQQLSEDLTGPKTPIISRSSPIKGVSAQVTNISYKSSQFHHSNITPESV